MAVTRGRPFGQRQAAGLSHDPGESLTESLDHVARPIVPDAIASLVETRSVAQSIPQGELFENVQSSDTAQRIIPV
jgi:hypothetical protein